MGVETIAAIGGLVKAAAGTTAGTAAITGAGTAIGSGLASSLMGQNKQPPPEVGQAPTGGSGMGAAAAQARQSGAPGVGGSAQFPTQVGPSYPNVDNMSDDQVAAIVRQLLGNQLIG